MLSPFLMIDGYKLDHRRQYPPNTTKVYSNWTPRYSLVSGQEEVVSFGLQYLLKRYMDEEFGNAFWSPMGESQDYKRFCESYLGPNTIGSEHVRGLCDLGYVPLEFKALPEGTRVPLKVPMFTVESTHPDFFWLVNYIETLLSNILWLPSTSATTAVRLRQLLTTYAKLTGGDLNFIPWQGHDFSYRGLPGLEAACLSGAGHLLSFTGTDTIPAIDFLEEFYGGEGLIGGSVAATEHSVMSAGGLDDEKDTFLRLLKLYPTGIVSVVSDTWDLWNVLDNILPAIKDKIMGREGKLVIRPDSGDPVKIICGDGAKEGAMEKLWRLAPGKVNEKGFKELDPHVGMIYGDGITYDRANRILQGLAEKGFCSTNIVFGVGSFSYQYVTRDTYGFAMKATWAEIDGKGVDLWKSPVTDDGRKFSAKGRLSVLERDGKLTLVEGDHKDSLLKTVWKDGVFEEGETSLADIRKRLWA